MRAVCTGLFAGTHDWFQAGVNVDGTLWNRLNPVYAITVQSLQESSGSRSASRGSERAWGVVKSPRAAMPGNLAQARTKFIRPQCQKVMSIMSAPH